MPKTQLEWMNYTKTATIKLGSFVLTAHEIEYAILRGAMSDPKIPSPYTDGRQSYAKFVATDPRAQLIYGKKERLLNFALYIPIK